MLFNSTSCVPRRSSKSVPLYTDNQVALVKATKNLNQANPATDEVRVENRNHGLAWSNSGLTEQPQDISVEFKSYYQVVIA